MYLTRRSAGIIATMSAERGMSSRLIIGIYNWTYERAVLADSESAEVRP